MQLNKPSQMSNEYDTLLLLAANKSQT